MASAVELLFKLNADASDAVAELSKLGKASNKETQQIADDFKDAAKGVEGLAEEIKDLPALEIDTSAAAKALGALGETAQKLDDKLAAGLDDYEAKLRELAPKLRKLSRDIAANSFDQADYDRQIGSLSPVLQKAIADAAQLGRGIRKVGDELRETGKDADKLSDELKAAGKAAGNAGDELRRAAKDVNKLADEFDQAKGEVDNFGKNTLLQLGNAAGLTAGQMAKLSAALPIVGAVAAGIAAGIGAAAVGLFQLAKGAAESGAEIDRLNKITGLSAETLSALRVASEQSGGSISEFEEAWESFVEVLNDGARGSEEAREKLLRLGLDPQKAFQDVEGSFARVVQVIGSIESPTLKAAAAADAMGESSLPLLPMFNELGSDLGAYTAKLKEMGLILDKEAVKQSKEFDQSLRLLQLQLKGLGFTLGREFMPDFQKGISDFSTLLKNNQATIKSWAEEIRKTVSGAINIGKGLYDFFQTPEGIVLLSILTGGGFVGVQAIRAAINSQASPKQPAAPVQNQNPTTQQPSTGGLNPDPYQFDKFSEAAKEQKKKFDEAVKNAREAGLQQIQIFRERMTAVYEDTRELMLKYLQEGKITNEFFKRDAVEREELFYQTLQKLYRAEAKAKLEAETDPNKLETVKQANLAGAEAIDREHRKRLREIETQHTDFVKKQSDERTKKQETDRKLTLENLKASNEAELAERKKNIDAEKGDLVHLAEFRKKIAAEEFNKRLEFLREDLERAKGKADEEKRINAEIETLTKEKQAAEIKGEQEIQEAIRETIQIRLEAKERAAEANREIQAVINDARDVQDGRAAVADERERARLERELEIGKNRRATLSALRDLEISIVNRRRDDELAEIERSRAARFAAFRYLQTEAELREKLVVLADALAKADEKDKAGIEAGISRIKVELELRKRLADLYAERSTLGEEEFQARRGEIIERSNGIITQKAIEAFERELQLKAELEALYQQQRLLSAEEFELKKQEILAKYQTQLSQPEGFAGGFFGALFGGLDEGIQKLENFGAVAQSVGQVVGGALLQMAQGIGNMVQQWVLLGNQAGNSMKKMVATTLAGVAAQAATLAIFHVAMGIAALTPWGAAIYGLPALHFKAAALWGTIAVGTAIAGRAVAGNSFQSAGAAGATASSGGGSNSGSNRSSSSTNPDAARQIEIERNQPQRVDLHVNVRSRDSHILDVIQSDVSNNGVLRNLIVKTAES